MESPFAFPKLAFSLFEDAESAYKVNNKFPDEILEDLFSLFGDIFSQACELIESYKFKMIQYKSEDGSRRVFKVSNYKEQFTVYEDLNFCFCQTFAKDVLETQECLTCKHVLATKLCKITGNCIEESLKDSQFVEFLNEQLNRLEDS